MMVREKLQRGYQVPAGEQEKAKETLLGCISGLER